MKKFLVSKLFILTCLFAIIFSAFVLRTYGVNWDQNQHLHPDERFLTIVALKLKWPQKLSSYFDPNVSPLNPYNNGFDFYVYGAFPLTFIKFFSSFLVFDKFSYNNITLVGRTISAFLDIFIVFLVFKIAEKIFDEKIGIIAAFFYSISVLPIQLSHFFAVDTFLVCLLTLSFYQLLKFVEGKSQISHSILLGISFGLALASKISALLFLPIILLGFCFLIIKGVESKKLTRSAVGVFLNLLVFLFFSYITLRISDPRIFSTSNFLNPTPNPTFIANIKQLKSFDNPQSLFPPAVQWLKTKPIIFPLKNMILWGLGLPLGVLTLASVFYSSFSIAEGFKKSFKAKSINQFSNFLNRITSQQFGYFLILSWILILFTYQGIQFTKTMRYFYPIYPFLAILNANFVYKFIHTKIKNNFLLLVIYLLLLIWPLSFIQIYSRPHSRVTASYWIYENVPPGSTISCEHWDDCLPLSLGSYNSWQFYRTETLELYNPDTWEKWKKVNKQLGKLDYLIMSSNRLWGSIPKVPEKYPQTAQFYNDLFSGKLQFIKVAEFSSYPTVPILNIPIPDDSSDESFTVYDHPKVIIYKKL